MYKFRTMYKNSHDLRDDLSELNTHTGPLFKLDADPRIIKGTEVLRKLSLDEIPQMLNVIKGDMSIPIDETGISSLKGFKSGSVTV